MHGELSQFAMPFDRRDKHNGQTYAKQIQRQVSQLTPAGRRLIALLLMEFNRTSGKPINRLIVGELLDRPSENLTPHDRKLLNQLCDLELLSSERVTLWTGDERPRGYQIEYKMPEDVAWALNVLARRSRKRSRST